MINKKRSKTRLACSRQCVSRSPADKTEVSITSKEEIAPREVANQLLSGRVKGRIAVYNLQANATYLDEANPSGFAARRTPRDLPRRCRSMPVGLAVRPAQNPIAVQL